VNVLIRVDASITTGSGHLMRCLALAGQLRREGADVGFACDGLPSSMMELIRRGCHRVVEFSVRSAGGDHQACDAAFTIAAASDLFPTGVDWLVVDHYALGVAWEGRLRPHVKSIMVIDDLANREHDCDILLDQNFYSNRDYRYLGLVPRNCTQLLGPSYVLLRPEFMVARSALRVRDGVIRRVLVFFGGTDPCNHTSAALDALRRWGKDGVLVDVVVGAENPWRLSVGEACRAIPNASFHCQVSNMAELIAGADLGIGAGGSAMWERCFLGLPTVTVVIAENQFRTTEDVAQQGGIIYLGWARDVREQDYRSVLDSLCSDPERVRKTSEAALKLVTPSVESVPQIMRATLHGDRASRAVCAC
jgi:UDP-2,4-diacetamido-2,4,6-trideoxy-beta-L-altropyranose hydrolase